MTEDHLSDYKNVMRIEGKAVVVYPEKDVKKFIKKYYNDIEDCLIIKMKDVPEHMVGIDLSWLDKELQRISDRLRNKLKERAGEKLLWQKIVWVTKL